MLFNGKIVFALVPLILLTNSSNVNTRDREIVEKRSSTDAYIRDTIKSMGRAITTSQVSFVLSLNS